jgi:uncharacterized protein YndB with AHSA1/START domain
MTTPDVPLRLELTVDLPGTPEQVWAAVATAAGNSSWFIPTEMEEREGGAVVFHMGDDSSSRGEVTGWDPPRRIEYAEPDWAGLSGHEGEPVTPLVTEFLVRARSGGTCTLTVVSSAFGTGADWEGEFFAEMEKGWLPYFDNLKLYLTRFPGLTATALVVEEVVAGSLEDVWGALRGAAGAAAVGDPVELHGLAGRVERASSPPDPALVLARLDDPVPGTLILHAWDKGNGEVSANAQGYLFSEDAPAYVEREEPTWRKWLASMSAPS